MHRTFARVQLDNTNLCPGLTEEAKVSEKEAERDKAAGEDSGLVQ